jgi:transposase
VTLSEMPHSSGHVFYHRLQEVLIAGGFDRFVETTCQPYYAPDGCAVGAAGALFPHAHGRLFRGHRQRALHRLAVFGSMSLRDFLLLESREKVPDHSWLSKTRGRLPHEVHDPTRLS